MFTQYQGCAAPVHILHENQSILSRSQARLSAVKKLRDKTAVLNSACRNAPKRVCADKTVFIEPSAGVGSRRRRKVAMSHVPKAEIHVKNYSKNAIPQNSRRDVLPEPEGVASSANNFILRRPGRCHGGICNVGERMGGMGYNGRPISNRKGDSC
jgi:hypothetical protein